MSKSKGVCLWNQMKKYISHVTFFLNGRSPVMNRCWLQCWRYEGAPKVWSLSIKIVCLSAHVSTPVAVKAPPSDAMQLLRHLFHRSKQRLSVSMLVPFRAPAVLCFISSPSAAFPFEDFSHPGTQKTSLSG